MLGKVIKHEWRFTYRTCVTIYIFMAAITLFACLSLHTPLWKSLVGDSYYYNRGITFLDIAGFIMLLIYGLTLAAAMIGIMIYLAVHFYKSMYTSEGYLTHTLPVSPMALFFGKTVVGSIWIIITQVAIAISIICLGFSFTTLFAPLSEILQGMSSTWEELAEIFPNFFDINWTMSFFRGILRFFLGIIISIITIYGSITIGQLASKHKVLLSFVSYFGIVIVKSIITYSVIIPLFFNMISESYYSGYSLFDYGGYGSVTTISSVVSALVAVGLFFLSNYIITNKLNLE